jgi:hypothetical protein
MNPSRKTPGAFVICCAVLAILAGFYLIARFTGDRAVEYPDVTEHFKYGSTGGERLAGIPYSVWMALPELFPEYLPGKGYASLGFLYEKGKDLPVGVSKRKYRGIDVVSFNCAICHMGSVRDDAKGEPRYHAGMPSNTVDLRGYYEFLFNVVGDSKFTPPLILAQIKNMGIREDFINKMILRYYAIYVMRDFLLGFKQRLAFVMEEPSFGPGRIDTFSPAKALFNFRMDRAPAEEKLGVADFPSIWYQRQREGMQLHWDGNNTKVEERNRSAAFGTGAYPASLDREKIGRIETWLLDAAPPRYPYTVRDELKVRGSRLYADLCADCHGKNGKEFGPGQGKIGTVTPINQIGTDRHRLDSYTFDLAVNQNVLYAEHGDERFSHFRKTYGYANMPLDGVWLRAPYLHNGSVPTLRDLLEPSTARPPVFYRGDDVYDPVKAGFVSSESERNGRKLFRYDTSVAGNSRQGHEGKAYGTDLPAADKDALVEYLKTF